MGMLWAEGGVCPPPCCLQQSLVSINLLLLINKTDLYKQSRNSRRKQMVDRGIMSLKHFYIPTFQCSSLQEIIPSAFYKYYQGFGTRFVKMLQCLNQVIRGCYGYCSLLSWILNRFTNIYSYLLCKILAAQLALAYEPLLFCQRLSTPCSFK